MSSDRLPEPSDARARYRNALIANALASPFNIGVFVATAAAGVLVGGPVILVLVVALLVYAIACARTFFDDEEAERVLAAHREERRRALEPRQDRIDPMTLAPAIREQLVAARATERRIREAIERAELPYEDVSREVDALVGLMERSARRAQLLHEGLEDTPVRQVKRRLEQLRAERDPAKQELVKALTAQLAVQKRMAAQLRRFYDEMERMVVELETVRGNLLSLSASSDAGRQQQLAGDVRALRDEMDAVATGMREAFEEPAPGAPTGPSGAPS